MRRRLVRNLDQQTMLSKGRGKADIGDEFVDFSGPKSLNRLIRHPREERLLIHTF